MLPWKVDSWVQGKAANRTASIAAYILILLLGLCWLVFCQSVPELVEDTHGYVGLAQSLRVNGNYNFDFVPHTIYPPGFPGLLAVLSWVAGTLPVDSYPLFMRFIGISCALLLLGSYLLIRRHTSPWWGLAYVSLIGVSSFMTTTATRLILSDIPYCLASLAVLLLIEYVPYPAKGRPRRWLGAVYLLLALLVPASMAMRAIGRAMLIGLVVWLTVSTLRTRRLPTVGLMIVLLMGIAEQAAWSFWTKAHDPGKYNYSYVSDVWEKDPHQPDMGPASAADLAKRTVWRTADEISHFAGFFIAGRWITPLPYSPLVAVPALLIAVGCLGALTAPVAGLMPYYFVAFSAILVVWPYDMGYRYMFPVLPLCFIYSWTGWQRMKNWVQTSPRRARRALTVFAALMLVWALADRAFGGAGIQIILAIAFWAVCLLLAMLAPPWSGVLPARVAPVAGVFLGLVCASEVPAAIQVYRQNLTITQADELQYPTLEAARWLIRNTSPDSVVMTFNSWMMHGETGRRTVNFPATSDVDQIIKVARETACSYLVILHETWFVPSAEDRLERIRKAYPSLLQPMSLTRDYQVYRFSPDGAGTP